MVDPSVPIVPDYGRPASRRKHLRPLAITAVVLMAIAVALSFLQMFTIRETDLYMDPVTATTTRTTTWFGFMKLTAVVDVSTLEQRLIASKIQWTRQALFVGGSGCNVFGRSTYCALGQTPPIYHQQNFLTGFATTATHAQLKQFVQTMQTGTREQQEAAARIAADATDTLGSGN